MSRSFRIQTTFDDNLQCHSSYALENELPKWWLLLCVCVRCQIMSWIRWFRVFGTSMLALLRRDRKFFSAMASTLISIAAFNYLMLGWNACRIVSTTSSDVLWPRMALCAEHLLCNARLVGWQIAIFFDTARARLLSYRTRAMKMFGISIKAPFYPNDRAECCRQFMCAIMWHKLNVPFCNTRDYPKHAQNRFVSMNPFEQFAGLRYNVATWQSSLHAN